MSSTGNGTFGGHNSWKTAVELACGMKSEVLKEMGVFTVTVDRSME
jgi:hypothetical protein